LIGVLVFVCFPLQKPASLIDSLQRFLTEQLPDESAPFNCAHAPIMAGDKHNWRRTVAAMTSPANPDR
jgi:hypothetical protein